jgi:hypothetical protein
MTTNENFQIISSGPRNIRIQLHTQGATERFEQMLGTAYILSQQDREN